LLNLKQILASTPRDVRQRSKNVVIIEARLAYRVRRILNSKKTKLISVPLRTLYATIYDRETAKELGKIRRHKLYIRAIDGPAHKLSAGNHVVVSCSCENFLYVDEVALNKKDAANIRYSNAKLPVETNPLMVPQCCKHLFRLGSSVILKGM